MTESTEQVDTQPDEVAPITPYFNQERTHVWMTNPVTGGTWECPIDYADIAVEDGWDFAVRVLQDTTVSDTLRTLVGEDVVEATPPAHMTTDVKLSESLRGLVERARVLAAKRVEDLAGEPTSDTELADALHVAAEAGAPDTDESTGWDPTAHNVDEVNAYLASVYETSPGEAARVLEVERANKNRVTVQDPTDSGDAGDPT